MTFSRCKILLVFVAFHCCNLTAAAAPEYEVKAAFIYNFARFIEWPAEQEQFQAGGSLYLCLLGEDRFRGSLEVLMNKEVRGRRIEVRELDDIGDHSGCDILYFSTSLSDDYRALLEDISREKGVLSVSDIDGFAENGGIIELYLEDNKVRFAINVKAARHAGLELSSQLLRLARIVE